jgi:hypothetical protein
MRFGAGGDDHRRPDRDRHRHAHTNRNKYGHAIAYEYGYGDANEHHDPDGYRHGARVRNADQRGYGDSNVGADHNSDAG